MLRGKTEEQMKKRGGRREDECYKMGVQEQEKLEACHGHLCKRSFQKEQDIRIQRLTDG